MKVLLDRLHRAYELVFSGGVVLTSVFLLLLRLYFFWQLFLTGKGKLSNIGKISEFFSGLGIPLPTLNAYFIGSLECFGSLLIIVGLAARPLSLLIAISMIVAYFTADFEAISSILSDSDKFVKADPFPFLLAALIIYVFGAGRFSVDELLQWRTKKLVRLGDTGSGARMESPAKTD
jgi:putative oxidoreductase